MIQEFLMEKLRCETKNRGSDMTWSVDYYYEKAEHTGTVYATGGYEPDEYDTQYRYPSYQVWIRSSDWGYAKLIADMTFDALHKYPQFLSRNKVTLNIETVSEECVRQGEPNVDIVYATDNEKQDSYIKSYHIFQITAASDPIRVGVENGIMEYSVNFDVTLIEL